MSKPEFWSDSETAKAVSKQYDDLKKEAATWQKLTDSLVELLELSKIFDSSGELDGHQSELTDKLQQLQAEYDRLEFAVLFSGKYDKENAVFSIHAGTGGVDAMDWAQILVRMYLRFCERHGFEAKIIDETAGGEAGIKSATIEVTGRYAYGWLKAEGGVHRLVRISPFDAEKMRHTSFALVEVLPELEEVESIEIKDEDIKVEAFRAGGHGGQSVNTTDSAVRLTHLPTGIAVKCQNERSQLQNKTKALKILKSRLLQYYQEEAGQKKEKIKGEYRQAQWGNQARSYVLQPYRLVKDHRTGYETADTDRVLDGEIDDFVGAYLKQQAGK